MGKAKEVLIKTAVFVLRFYQVCLSRLINTRCRFYPSCSSYAIEAIEKHGLIIGAWLATKRLLKCQPFCNGGYDPVR